MSLPAAPTNWIGRVILLKVKTNKKREQGKCKPGCVFITHTTLIDYCWAYNFLLTSAQLFCKFTIYFTFIDCSRLATCLVFPMFGCFTIILFMINDYVAIIVGYLLIYSLQWLLLYYCRGIPRALLIAYSMISGLYFNAVIYTSIDYQFIDSWRLHMLSYLFRIVIIEEYFSEWTQRHWRQCD